MWNRMVLLLLVIILGCESTPKQAVIWSPENIRQGQQLTINYFPKAPDALIKNPQDLILIYQVMYTDSEIVELQPMQKKGSHWVSKINLDENACLISFKFEDGNGIASDNNGRGWNVIVRTPEGRDPPDAHYHLGLVLDGTSRPHARPNYAKALSEYQKELALYPQNYKALLKKWETQLAFEPNPEKLKDQIKAHLDSLLQIRPTDAKILELAFHSYWKIFNDIPGAIPYGEKFLNTSTDEKGVAENAYFLILLRYRNDPLAQLRALEGFVQTYPRSKYTRSAWFRIGAQYQQLRNRKKAQQAYERCVALDPSDVPLLLTLANIAIQDGAFSMAQNLIERAFENCKINQLTRVSPWNNYEQRQGLLNLNLCQAYSTMATLNFRMGDYAEAVQNRKKVLELGSPFPAYEWVGIGKAYQRLGDIAEAQQAYIKALSISPEQQEARDSLRVLFMAQGGQKEEFDVYLTQEIAKELRASARPAPDFEVYDINGNKCTLSEMKGKIVVMNFWDTWSAPCRREIPQLNQLVDMFAKRADVVFLAISIQDRETIKKFVQETEFRYRQLCEGQSIKTKYQILGFPTHLIVDREGLIRFRQIGYSRSVKDELAREINKLLEESTSPVL